MKKFFFVLAITFGILLIVNIAWIAINIYMFLVHGIESVVTGETLIENIYFSLYLRWILLFDVIWIVACLCFGFGRKSYKTDSKLHYLQYSHMPDPKICLIIPTFNEESSIGQVVRNFASQKFVNNVIVIDNNSNDKTVEIAEKAGAKIIAKKENKGYSHSLVLGFKEALKTDCNIIAAT